MFTPKSGSKIDIIPGSLSIEPEENLYYFDEPIIFTSNIGLDKYIVFKFDDDEDEDIYFLSKTEAKLIDLVKNGQLSLRGALSETIHFVYANSYVVSEAYSFKKSELSSGILPEYGVSIAPEFTGCPDYAPRSNTFTVRLFGGSLNNYLVNLSSFRSTISKFQDVAKAALLPIEYDDLQGKNFNFVMSEPDFSSSMVLSVNDFSFEVERIAEHLGDSSIDGSEINKRVKGEFDDFFKNMQYAKGSVEDKSNSMSISDLNRSDLSAIRRILPNDKSFYDGIEFYGRFLNRDYYFRFDLSQSQALSKFIDDASVENQSIVGYIQIINSKSKSFVIKPENSKLITCKMSLEFWELAYSKPEFRVGAMVNVFGSLSRRKLRDLMHLTASPEVVAVKGISANTQPTDAT